MKERGTLSATIRVGVEGSFNNQRLGEFSLAIVCPMANESETAQKFVMETLSECAALGSVQFFAVIDQASQDATPQILEELACTEPRLNVIWAPENTCIAEAYIKGYKEALLSGADWILEIDAGFSHQPSDIPQFFQPMLDGHDCVFGSRFMTGGQIIHSSWRRRIVSWGGSKLTNVLLGSRLTDMTSGFEMFTAAALKQAVEKGIHSRAHYFQTEMKLHCRNMKIVEVPIHYRFAGGGRIGGPVREALRQLWRLFKARLSGL